MNKHLLSVILVFLCLFIGKTISTYLTPTVPGSIWGMILMALSLELGIFKEDYVAPFSNLLLRNMALFFVPPGVGVVLYFSIIREEFVPVVVSIVVSTLVVMAVTGHVFQAVSGREK